MAKAGDGAFAPIRCPNPPRLHSNKKDTALSVSFLLVEAGGFGPPKRNATDLQSAPFGHSGTLPYIFCFTSKKMELVDGLEPPTC